jgi:uncharacterized protein YbjT (DUF2867 family)
MYPILGATGNTGGAAAQALLAQGQAVRAVGRSRARLATLEQGGAQPFLADVEDAGALREAFAGARAAWLLVPPNLAADDFRAYQRRVTAAITDAVRATGLRRVAVLSSIGGQHAAGTGPIVGLHELEEALRAVEGLDVLAVRAGYFFQNFLMNVGLVKSQGVNGSAVAPDVPVPMVAAADIGRYAAARLLAADFRRFQPVTFSHAALTMAEATRVLGAAIGKPDLPYVRFPDEGVRGALVGAGLKPAMAELYVEMSRGANEGLLQPAEGVPHDHAPTSLEDFAQVFAAVYRQS